MGTVRPCKKKLIGPFFSFSAASGSLEWPLRSWCFWNLNSVCQEVSKMVWHLNIGSKMRLLGPPEALSQIWANSLKKFKAPEQPLLEVRRFFQWCQGMSLGILKRFREKKVKYFFQDFDWLDYSETSLKVKWLAMNSLSCLAKDVSLDQELK